MEAVFNATCSVSSAASVRYIDDTGHVTADVPLTDQPVRGRQRQGNPSGDGRHYCPNMMALTICVPSPLSPKPFQRPVALHPLGNASAAQREAIVAAFAQTSRAAACLHPERAPLLDTRGIVTTLYVCLDGNGNAAQPFADAVNLFDAF
jgi:hypothetical protein